MQGESNAKEAAQTITVAHTAKGSELYRFKLMVPVDLAAITADGRVVVFAYGMMMRVFLDGLSACEVCVLVCARVCVCMFSCAHVCACTVAFALACAYSCSCVHACIFVCTCMCMYVSMCVLVYVYALVILESDLLEFSSGPQGTSSGDHRAQIQ